MIKQMFYLSQDYSSQITEMESSKHEMTLCMYYVFLLHVNIS